MSLKKNKSVLKRNVSMFLFYMFFYVPILGQKTVVIQDGISEYPLGKKITYFEDKTNSKKINEIADLAFSKNFTESNENNPSFGFQDSTYWAKIILENKDTSADQFILEQAFPPTDFIELYYSENEKYQSIILGDSLPFETRLIQHRNYIFPIQIPMGQTKTFYFKLKTKSVTVFRLSLFSEEYYFLKTTKEQFLYGIFYGIFILLILTNIFLFLSLREKVYFYYTLFTFFLGMYFFIFNGFAYWILWPNSSFWNDIANPLFMTLALLTSIRTSIHFLKIQEYSSTVRDLLDALSLLTLMNVIFLFIFPYKFSIYYIYIILVPATITIFVGAIISLIRKNPMAKFFVIGFSGFIGCAIFTTLNNLGILTSYASPDLMQIASAVAIFLLSIGLAYRYYILKQLNLEIETKSMQINTRLSRIQSELEISKKIHSSLLPGNLPDIKNARIYAKYLPSSEIGGDFYDFHSLEKKYLGIFIADVTGHGVPAALFASTVKFSFSREIEFMKEPSTLLANINSSLFEKIGNNLLSAAYLYLDMENRRLTYASCGHPPLLIWKKEEKDFIELKPRGRLIGISRDIILHDTIYKLEKGDRVLFYTDGLIECEDSQGNQFGENALLRFTMHNEDLDAEEFANELVKRLTEYSATPGKFNDDVTFIVIDIL